MDRYWKLPWNPQGYKESTFVVSTSGMATGDILKLQHSFFKGESLVATNSKGKKLVISATNAKADILLDSKDSYLSAISRFDVYSQVKLNTTATLNTELTITCSYICDSFDPEDFEQPLNTIADVQHNSLLVVALGSYEASTNFLRVSDSMDVPNGTIDNDRIVFHHPTMELGDIVFSQDKIQVPSINLEGSNCYLRYNKDTNSWEINNGYLIKASTHLPLNGVAIIDPTDSDSITCVPWLKVNGELRGIETEYASVKTVDLDGTIISKKDGVISIGDISILQDGTIKMGPVTFTKENLIKLNELLATRS